MTMLENTARSSFDPVLSMTSGLVEQLLTRLGERIGAGVSFELRVLERLPVTVGPEAPTFVLHVKTPRAVGAVLRLSESAMGEAYLDGEISVEGSFVEALRLRSGLHDGDVLSYFWSTFAKPLWRGQTRQDELSIAEHYDEDPDFYHAFLDRQWRCYSHGYFERDDEPLEEATTRKLATALAAVRAKPGDRVLDIGAGWGAFIHFAGERGVEVTSLTISARSEEYVRELIERRALPCRVVRRHFLEYGDERPFDAIVNLGVSEHLPDYEATAAQYLRLLKPGGRVFLDACTALVRNPFSSFVRKHVWSGNGTPLVLSEYVAAILRSGLEIKHIADDRWSYYLTTKAWAERLEAAREELVERFGARQYRRFRLYLWGCAHGFATRNLGANNILLQRPGDTYARENFHRAWGRLPLARLWTARPAQGG
jgi:cyclopropane-fatty-acyl-phospholipid synthase